MARELIAVPVVSKNGLRGTIFTYSRLFDDSPEKKAVWETGREVMVPAANLHLRTDGSFYLNLTVDPGTPSAKVEPTAADEVVIPRIEEQVEISKRTVETGRVRVSKTVSEDPITIDEPTVREEYEVQRVPVNRVVDEPSGPRREGDVTIIPVYEEVVLKQLLLREEIHLVKRRSETHAPQTISLRKEQVDVDHIRYQPVPSKTPETNR